MKSSTRTLLIALGFLLAGFLGGRACSSTADSSSVAPGEASSTDSTVWTCSMHPQVRLPEQGKCPICFMDLIPANSGEEEDLPPRTIQLSDNARALAEIETSPVERRTVAREVNMTGKVALDETRVAYITSWVSGRLDRLFVDYTGVTVREGDHLVEIYSPTLYSAQQELLQAIATAKRLEGSSLDILRSTSDQTVISAREKLRLYGLSEEQIQEMVNRGLPDKHVTIYAPIGGVVVHKNVLEGMYVEEGTRIYTIADLSKIWVLFDAYESDLSWLRYGQDVEFQVQAYPGETFHGRIAFIDPLLDDRTRTVKVRLNVENAGLRLKPDMFVTATAKATLTDHGRVVDADLADRWMCPMHPEVIAEELVACVECGMDLVPASELGFEARAEGDESLVIPHTAPLITGKRAVVYVRVPDADRPTYTGRDVELGPRAGDWYVVKSGLEAGEEVVVHGNFKLDSELQIRGMTSMMNPAEMDEVPGLIGVPDGFRTGLGEAVEHYLGLQTALASDSDSAESAQSLASVLKALDADTLGEASAALWREKSPLLLGAVSALAEAPDLDSRRNVLSPFTEAFLVVLREFGYERDTAVHVVHCPMALDGEGANWIQAEEQIANPYYGSSMLRCGAQVETLQTGN